MRGTQSSSSKSHYCSGIIPAYAGNTCLWHWHPFSNRGSSPRMRGTLHGVSVRSAEPGIIPAYAGNTFRDSHGHVIRRDHPRVCGEHWWLGAESDSEGGSSPRMRGTHVGRYRHCANSGIIPAYAGNTHVALRTYNSCRDHPRVCGEHTKRL